MKLILLILLFISHVSAKVYPVTSLDFFYDNINKNDTYCMVKYYTTWCSHCKRLQPVFEKLSESFSNMKFLEVNCDVFGSTLCQRLPGFPIIELVLPLPDNLSTNEDNDIPEGWISKWLYKLKNGNYNPKKRLSIERVIEFKGSRDLLSLSNFINVTVTNEQIKGITNDIITGKNCNGNNICESGKEFMNSIKHKDLFEEKMKLINNIEPNKDNNTIILNLKISIINKLLDNPLYDEL